MNSTVLGKAIRARRLEQKITLRALARRIKISAPYLSDIELGRRIPSRVVLDQLTEILGLNTRDLLACAWRFDERTTEYLETHSTLGRLVQLVADLRLNETQLQEAYRMIQSYYGGKTRRRGHENGKG